eukprot:sb/3476386/
MTMNYPCLKTQGRKEPERFPDTSPATVPSAAGPSASNVPQTPTRNPRKRGVEELSSSDDEWSYETPNSDEFHLCWIFVFNTCLRFKRLDLRFLEIKWRSVYLLKGDPEFPGISGQVV